MCIVLPSVIIKEAVSELEIIVIPHDIVTEELKAVADKTSITPENLVSAITAYMLGFSSYKEFAKCDVLEW